MREVKNKNRISLLVQQKQRRKEMLMKSPSIVLTLLRDDGKGSTSFSFTSHSENGSEISG